VDILDLTSIIHLNLMLTLKAKSVMRSFGTLWSRSQLSILLLAACVAISAPAHANCPGYTRPIEEANREVRQRANQLKADPNQFFGKKMIDGIENLRIVFTPAFDRLTGLEKQQVINTLQLDGSTYTVHAADGRLLSAQYDGCTHRTAILTERDRYGWYFNRPPVPMPFPRLRDALRNPGEPRWRKVNHMIHPEDERRARFKFWETVGYAKASQGWWITWVPEGGYFEVTVGNADDAVALKPYFAKAARQYRYVVLATDGSPLYDTAAPIASASPCGLGCHLLHRVPKDRSSF
jgi:hypothetical protein